MHFFIDETGSFSGWEKFPSLSLLGALIVPDERLKSLEAAYGRLRPHLPQANGEVKGRLLTEAQVQSIVEMLFHHSVIFEAIGIDLGTHTLEAVKEYQQKMANGMTVNLTNDHPEWMQKEVWEWRRQYEALSAPLVIQTELMFRLAKRLIDHGTMYFSQRRPKELAHFHWVIDAKGDQGLPTAWEQWWSQFIMPWLQNNALAEPFSLLPVGDYSHMKRFEGKLSPFWREMIKPTRRDAPAMSLDRILGESLRFSKIPEPGLELADIITNATRRALVGNLDRSGWINIPRLMLHAAGPHYVQMISLRNDEKGKYKRPYASVLREFARTGRVMLLKDRKRWPEI